MNGALFVMRHIQNGIVGVGVSIGGEPACHIIENHLSRFVEGQVRVGYTWSSFSVSVTPCTSFLPWFVYTTVLRWHRIQDVRNVELIWDQMYRATTNYGRKGLPIQVQQTGTVVCDPLLGLIDT